MYTSVGDLNRFALFLCKLCRRNEILYFFANIFSFCLCGTSVTCFLRYGCRRFIRDGYRTALEDPGRLYYEPWELRSFEGIECEWPVFVAWLLLDAVFRDDFEDASQYKHLLDSLTIKQVGD